MALASLPHPGPAPVPFAFPFEEAAEAARATEEVIAAVDAVVEATVAAAAEARIGFEGAARVRFDRGLDAALDDLGTLRRHLTADLGGLEDDVALARRRAAEADDERRRWQMAQWRWEEGARQARASTP